MHMSKILGACLMAGAYLKCGRLGFTTLRQTPRALTETFIPAHQRQLTTPTRDQFQISNRKAINSMKKGSAANLYNLDVETPSIGSNTRLYSSNSNGRAGGDERPRRGFARNLIAEGRRRVHNIVTRDPYAVQLKKPPKKSRRKNRNSFQVQHEGNLLLEEGLKDDMQVQILGEGVRGSLLVRPNDADDETPWMPVAVRVRSYAQSIHNPGKFNFGAAQFWNNKNVTAALMGRCPLIMVNLHHRFVWYVPAKDMTRPMLNRVLNMQVGSRNDVLYRRSLERGTKVPFLAKDLLKAYHSGKYMLGTEEEFSIPITDSCRKEYESRIIGSRLLDILGLEFQDPPYLYSVVDGIIQWDGELVNVQEKCCGQSTARTISAGMKTTGKSVPYHRDDFDLLMGYYPREHNKRETHLFAIPTHILLQNGIVNRMEVDL